VLKWLSAQIKELFDMVKKRRRKKPGFLILAILLAAVTAAYVYRSIPLPERTKPEPSDVSVQPLLLSNKASYPSGTMPLSNLNSPNIILIRLSDHATLLERNGGKIIYPASLTKMMTAIIAIENIADLQEEITISKTMYQSLVDEGASLAGFLPGERVRAIDLLYGVMLPSGAEACIGLAEHIAGSERGFVKLMNQKASDVGMDNTHFENTTGLHHDNHYTTVEDMAVLLNYALQNGTFREIFTSSRHSTHPTNLHPDGITFYSTMFEKLENPSITGGEILGGKTGYTREAGLCLASLAMVGEEEYILISAGARGNHETEQYNITDAITVYSSIGK